MIKFDRKKKLLLFANLVIFVLIGYFVFRSPTQQRKISSIENSDNSDIDVLDEVSLSWDENEYGLIFKVKDNDGKICEKFNRLDVVFRAEGIAYSGEVDRVQQTSSCEEGRFQQTWVPNLAEVGGDYQKTGIFGEEPPKWVMEKIMFDGPAGRRELSYQQIKNQYGTVPSLNPR